MIYVKRMNRYGCFMKIIRSVLMCVVLGSLTGCYCFPADDCVSTVPITNNPTIVPQRSAGMMPNMKY